MKNIMKKFIRILQNIFFFLLGILFSFIPEKKKNKSNRNMDSSHFDPKISSLIAEENNSDDASDSRERFSEYLKHSFSIDVLFIEQEIQKNIEKFYNVDLKELSLEEERTLKKYQGKIIQKVMEQKDVLQSEPEIQKFILKQILKDKKEKFTEKKIEQFVSKDEKEKEIFSMPARKQEFFPKSELLKEPQMSKEEIIIEKNFHPEMLNANFPLPKPILDKQESELSFAVDSMEEIKPKFEPIFEKEEEITISETNRVELIPEKKEILKEEKEEEIVSERISEKKDEVFLQLESKLKDQNIPKKEEAKPESLKEEKKKATFTISFSSFEKEQEVLQKKMELEIQKEEFEEKDYELLEKSIQEKIDELENLFEQPLTEAQKQETMNQLEKFKKLKAKVSLHKESDLEDIRVSLEEGIPLEEIEEMKKRLFEVTQDRELKRLEEIQDKAEEEIRNIDKMYVKEEMRKILRRLEMPLFLSFPFIKNKYFRRFVSGLFVFSGLGFLKRIVFGSPMEQIDWTLLQKGSDALTESIFLLEKNLTTVKTLKEGIFLKYPELQYDEEFLYYLSNVEENLEKNYEKLLKQQKTVAKYFAPSKALTRKRRKIA